MSYLGELRQVWGHRALPSVGVSVLIQDEQGRILLQRRGDDALWGTVGGALEPGEDFLTAARRELREETGLSAAVLTPLELYAGAEYRFTYPHGDVIDNVSVLFGASGVSGEVRLPPDEIHGAAWFSLADLPPDEELSGPLIQAKVRSWQRRDVRKASRS